MTRPQLTAGTGGSVVVDRCQVCEAGNLERVLFLGYLPPVNGMPAVGTPPAQQPSYPALLLRCPRCRLFQLGLIVDPHILFPPEYPYTSGTTRILRENFAEQYQECRTLFPLGKEDLVVDIGSNDGTLLANYAGAHRVQGIEPADVGHLAVARGIPTLQGYFDAEAARAVREAQGPARLVTCANAFAHMEGVHGVVEGILSLLAPDGVFLSESHYVHSLVEMLQYDTIYHEHLRYYSLTSLAYLLGMHGLEVFHARPIPTHGGSLRVYAARRGTQPVRESVGRILEAERQSELAGETLHGFQHRVTISKLELQSRLLDLKLRGHRIFGVGAPSRAATLINYVGLDDGIVDCVLEVPGSNKIGKYMPGTQIPVVDEDRLFQAQPECALLLSWHIADELMPKLRAKGYQGDFLLPLPRLRIVRGSELGVA